MRIAASILVAFQRTTWPERRISCGEPSTGGPSGSITVRRITSALATSKWPSAISAASTPAVLADGHRDLLRRLAARLGERRRGVGDQAGRVAHGQRPAGEGGALELGVEDDLVAIDEHG